MKTFALSTIILFHFALITKAQEWRWVQFGNNFYGGTVLVNEEEIGCPNYFHNPVGTQYDIGAIEQTSGSYYFIWAGSENNEPSEWTRTKPGQGSTPYSPDQYTTYTLLIDDGLTTPTDVEAQMRRLCNFTFENDFGGGVIIVNGSQYSSPAGGFEVIEKNTITAQGVNQTINNIEFTFDYFESAQQGVVSSPFTAEYHDVITAYYDAKPGGWYRNLMCTSDVGELIALTWNDHPSTDVTSYEIWRKRGSGGTPVKIGTVNRGVGAWTDPDYTRTGDTSDPMMQYDVRAYYAPQGTTGDPYFENIAYGTIEASIVNNDTKYEALESKGKLAEETISFSASNFPNPFNPTTNISYSLTNEGFVSLKVYDLLGKEIATLVNVVKSSGQYTVPFNASNLPSGVYIYTLQTNGRTLTRKMLLLR